MKCAILETPGTIRIDVLPDPQAGAGDVIVKIRAALTCGTDLKAYRRGHPKMPCPTPFGHEFAGDIVEVGSGVDGFAVGDSVMSANTGPCGACFFCDRAQENLCSSIMDEMILGAYAEYVRVPSRVVRSNVYRKPDGLPFEQAALLEPLSSVCFGAAELTPDLARSDATALVIGAGPIALLWLAVLREAGIGRVIVAGRRRPRLEVARALGADVIVGEGDDLPAAINEATDGRGADVVVECTGSPDVWEQAPGYARKGGMVVLFGGCKQGTGILLDTYAIHYDGIRITSPFHFRPKDVAEAFRLLNSTSFDWSRFITSHAALDELAEVFERLETGEDIKCAILPHLPGGGS
jgi:L-iditol 2-dehydrogenase